MNGLEGCDASWKLAVEPVGAPFTYHEYEYGATPPPTTAYQTHELLGGTLVGPSKETASDGALTVASAVSAYPFEVAITRAVAPL